MSRLPNLMTIDEVAKELGLSRSTVYRHARNGTIPGVVRIGNTVRFSRPELEAWIGTGEGSVKRIESEDALTVGSLRDLIEAALDEDPDLADSTVAVVLERGRQRGRWWLEVRGVELGTGGIMRPRDKQLGHTGLDELSGLRILADAELLVTRHPRGGNE